MYTCMNCGHETLSWQCDYDFEDVGMEGEGIVSIWYCQNCGAMIEVFVPCNQEAENE